MMLKWLLPCYDEVFDCGWIPDYVILVPKLAARWRKLGPFSLPDNIAIEYQNDSWTPNCRQSTEVCRFVFDFRTYMYLFTNQEGRTRILSLVFVE
jgi:Na+(H+)/acetate symporter ActP